jgi:ADP-ribose pyrophosphatase
MSSIKILSQKPILDADLFSVVETKLDLNGTTHTHRNIYRPPIASVFPLTDKGEIYLIKQYRYLHQEIFLEEVAGHVESNETPKDAAIRELEEEAGIKASTMKQIGFFSGNSSVIKSDIYFFVAQGLHFGEAKPEEDEDIVLMKMSLHEAVSLVLSGKIKNSIASLGILLIAQMRALGKL